MHKRGVWNKLYEKTATVTGPLAWWPALYALVKHGAALTCSWFLQADSTGTHTKASIVALLAPCSLSVRYSSASGVLRVFHTL